MVYLVAAIVGLLASLISIILFVKAVTARVRRQGFSQGAIGVRIVSPVPLAIVITAFAAGFFAVLRVSN
jgi:hypothetical protein